MPNLFERIDVSLGGNDLAVRVSLQSDNLTAVAGTVAGLINSPPQGISDLQQALMELPLPDLTVSGDFAATLSSLKVALPPDLSSVTGTLTAGLQQLKTRLDNDFTEVLDETSQVMSAIHRLTKIDLSCEDGEEITAGASTDATSTTASTAPAGSESGTVADGASASAGATSSASSPVASALDQANGFFDRLPSPLNVETFLAWLRDVSDSRQRNAVLPYSLPVIDDLHDALETLFVWKSMSATEIRKNLSATLGNIEIFINSVDALLAKLSLDLTDHAARLQTDVLAQVADGLTSRLVELRTAIATGNLSSTGPAIAAINELMDRYDALRLVLETEVLGQLSALSNRINALPDDLEDRMSHVISILRPNGSLGELEPFSQPPVVRGADEDLAELGTWLKTLTDWLEDLLGKLDLPALQAPISAVAGSARAAVDGLDEGMVKITLEVQKLFGNLETLLQQVDTEALTTPVEAAIQKFKTELTEKLADLFAPVREIVSQIILSISGGLDTFDPEDVVESLREVIQTLMGVLQDPAVTSAVEAISNTVNAAAQQIENLSFAPLTDQVIAGIEEIGDTIQSIDTSQLNAALQAALQAALAVLPEDLTPVTDPLIDELGVMVETGPVPLVATIQLQPQQLLVKVRHFEPAALIGDALSKPFQSLLAQMEAFGPGALLKPVQEELEKLKDRLRNNANPGRALQPLEQPFAELIEGLDRLRPDELIKPLEEKIAQMIADVLKASPLEELASQLGVVVQKAEQVVSVGAGIASLMNKVQATLNGFADAQAQMDAWLNSILAKIESSDPAFLQPVFARLAESLDRTRAAALSARINSAVDPLLATLTVLDAQNRLTALIQAHRGISGEALAALPESTEKAALSSALNRFNPLRPIFSAPYQRLEDCRQTLLATKARLQVTLAGWDTRYHSAGGTLDCLRLSGVTSVQLRQWIREALESPFIRPLNAFFAILEQFSSAVSKFLAPVQGLINDLQTRLQNLLLGPDSLGGIHDSLQQLIKRLQDFNLSFLRESLADLHAQVRSKLEAVSPAHLRQVVETSFDQMLQSLDLGQVISAGDLAKLEAEYAKVIAKLKTLDPGELVIKVVQPEFEQKVIPILASFDLTKILAVLIEKLRGLDDELKAEMGRVNEAYRSLRRSMPSLSLSVDVGISI
jgi:hypothetical protein